MIRDTRVVLDLGWTDFLVFRGNEHRGHSDELKLRSLDLNSFEIAIDKAHSEEQSLRLHLKFKMHLDDPIHKDSAHVLMDVRLIFDVVRIRLEKFLFSEQNLVDFRCVFSHSMRVTQALSVERIRCL